jgi:hypothetical protein
VADRLLFEARRDGATMLRAALQGSSRWCDDAPRRAARVICDRGTSPCHPPHAVTVAPRRAASRRAAPLYACSRHAVAPSKRTSARAQFLLPCARTSDARARLSHGNKPPCPRALAKTNKMNKRVFRLELLQYVLGLDCRFSIDVCARRSRSASSTLRTARHRAGAVINPPVDSAAISCEDDDRSLVCVTVSTATNMGTMRQDDSILALVPMLSARMNPGC